MPRYNCASNEQNQSKQGKRDVKGGRAFARMGAAISACLVLGIALVFGMQQFMQDPAPRQDGSVVLDAPEGKDAPTDERSVAQPVDSEDDASIDAALGYVHDEVIVSIAPGMNAEDINAKLAGFEFAATKDVSDQDLEAGFVVIELADGADVRESASTFESAGLGAQPNYVYTIAEESEVDLGATVQDDSGLFGQDGLADASRDLLTQKEVIPNDPERSRQWALDSVNAYRAWGIERAGTSDSGVNRDNPVSIAFIDTGVDIDHEDLAASIRATYRTSADNQAPSEDPAYSNDEHGHGTHVSGIAAGIAGNSKGIAGASYNAGIVAIKATKTNTSTDNSFNTVSLARSYEWLFSSSTADPSKTNAEYYNVRVVNMSIGAAMSPNTSEDYMLLQRIREAYEGNSSGRTFPSILTVTAAGNSMTSAVPPYIVYPGEDEYCLSVINLAQSADWSPANNVVTRNSGSNYNVPGTKSKTISAPGTSIYSTTNNGSYKSDTGTSMAAPLVAGIASLVFSENPDLTAAQVKDIIETSARDVGSPGWDEETGYGELDAYHALQIASAALGGDDTVERGGEGSINILYGDGTSWGSDEPSSPSEWEWTVEDDDPNAEVVKLVVNATGGKKSVTLQGVNMGTATITATLKDAEGNADTGVVLTKTVTVTKNGLASQATVGDIANQPYTGKAIEPKPVVTVAGKTLVEGVDYRLSYENNVNAGTATVIITGMGEYGGEVRKNFTITPLSIGTAVFVGLDESYAHTGKAIEPTFSVKLGSTTLKQGTDYTVSYKNNVNSGTATITITGKGNYAGTVTRTFLIAPSITPSMITVKGLSFYTGKALTPEIVVRTSNGTVLKEHQDYDITGYSNNVDAGVNTARVTISGRGAYSGVATKPFTIMPQSLATVSISIDSQAYTGDPITPTPTVTLSGFGTLKSGTDYTVTYRNNVNVGTATATITGKGNFAGTASKNFKITGKVSSSPSTPSTKPQGTQQPSQNTGKDEPQDTQPAKGVDMHRMYNPNSGEHFYTSSSTERDSLVKAGWRYEGTGWTAPETSSTPVYRLYSGTDHHYTTSTKERDSLIKSGWSYEGIGWYSDDQKRVPLYRQFNPNVDPSASRNNSGSHNYTASKSENDDLVKAGWKGEGIAWYGM